MRTWEAQKEYEMELRREWLQELCDSGMTPQSICQLIGMSPGSFYKMLRQHGIKANGERPRKFTDKQLYDFWKTSETVRSFAKRFSVSEPWVYTRARQLGLPYRKQGSLRPTVKKVAPAPAVESSLTGKQRGQYRALTGELGLSSTEALRRIAQAEAR